MNRINRMGRAALFVVIVSLFAVSVNAQTITSATSSTALNLTIAESLTVAATPSSINFTGYNYSAGTATASAPISVVTSGNFGPGTLMSSLGRIWDPPQPHLPAQRTFQRRTFLLL